jgi:hypothetical protein
VYQSGQSTNASKRCSHLIVNPKIQGGGQARLGHHVLAEIIYIASGCGEGMLKVGLGANTRHTPPDTKLVLAEDSKELE